MDDLSGSVEAVITSLKSMIDRNGPKRQGDGPYVSLPLQMNKGTETKGPSPAFQ